MFKKHKTAINQLNGGSIIPMKMNLIMMKPFRKLIIALAGMTVIAFYSCDVSEYVIGDFWFVNKTGHKINVNSFCIGEVNSELSFTLLPYDSVKRVGSGRGYPRDPFTHACPLDSIVLVFNDTLSLNTFKHREFPPMIYEIISETKFRYEFTEAHYQKALEVNSFLR